jgi:hypothetical protein
MIYNTVQEDKMTSELNEMWQRVEALPEKLSKIWMAQWDYTGRPTRDFNYTLLELLQPEVSPTFADYKSNFKQLMAVGDMNQPNDNEIERHWFLFIAGAQFIANNLAKDRVHG